MYPHRIRLRGPWTCTPLSLSATNELPPAFRMTMPGRWSDAGLHDFRGRVRCVRPFGYPGRLDAFEHVWLTFAGLEGQATVILNDQVLGTINGSQCPSEFEITGLLLPRNLLSVEIESNQQTGGLWGEVALEVRAAAFLKDVRFACHSGQLTAVGLVVGEAARPLDLYLFAADRFLTHSLIQPLPTGQPFTLPGSLDGLSWPTPLPVRVELVDAAVIWYVVQDVV